MATFVAGALGGVDSTAQFLPLLQQGHEEGGHLVGVTGVLTGSDILNHGILGIAHDLTPQMRGLDLDDVTPILEDSRGLAHQIPEFILKSERIFHIHGYYLLLCPPPLPIVLPYPVTSVWGSCGSIL